MGKWLEKVLSLVLVRGCEQCSRGAETRGLYKRFFKVRPSESKNSSELSTELKYYEGEPVIREIKRVFVPGRRVYAKINDLPRVFNGRISIISTPRGVMFDNEARAANVGGEVLCQVF